MNSIVNSLAVLIAAHMLLIYNDGMYFYQIADVVARWFVQDVLQLPQ